ncbi:MAG: hypothetical protein GY795_12415 [Desulfobacterales bacterium]|nr:hypothetical protein [Desulfobacterales bacterium]
MDTQYLSYTPEKRYKLFLITGASVIIFELLRTGLFNPKLTNFYQVEMLRNLIGYSINSFIFSSLTDVSAKTAVFEFTVRFIRDIGADMILSSMIICGIVSVRQKGINFRNASLLSASLLISVTLIGITVYSYDIFQEYDNTYINEAKFLEKMKTDIREKKFSDKDMPKWSELYARSAYEYFGKKVNYMKPDGEWAVYLPDKSSRHMRKLHSDSIILINRGKNAVLISILLWIIIIPGSMITGVFISPDRISRKG